MNFESVSLPEVYTNSFDFRTFLKWFSLGLSKIGYDIENALDLIDPMNCKSELLWMLADTIGFKYDSRLPVAFNRLVLVYFMSMIRNRGSKDGVTLAAETNLAQFVIQNKAAEKEINGERLDDTSIPVNSVYVTPYTDKGYIDIVYFSDRKPIDACVEYVRPLGMYCFQNAGVRYDGRTKISIDARLTNISDVGLSIGSTHVGHYSRDDYASLQSDSRRYTDDELDDMVESIAGNLQQMYLEKYQRTVSVSVVAVSYDKGIFKATISSGGEVIREMYVSQKDYLTQEREPVYYRNIRAEGEPKPEINPGYRALYSLQLANNDEVVKGLLGDRIFSIGFGPQTEGETYENIYYTDDGIRGTSETDVNIYKPYNLGYDRNAERTLNESYGSIKEVYLLDPNDMDSATSTQSVINPVPAVNPVMSAVGDAISLNADNTTYTKVPNV